MAVTFSVPNKGSFREGFFPDLYFTISESTCVEEAWVLVLVSAPKTGLDPPTKVSASAEAMSTRPSGTNGDLTAPRREPLADAGFPNII